MNAKLMSTSMNALTLTTINALKLTTIMNALKLTVDMCVSIDIRCQAAVPSTSCTVLAGSTDHHRRLLCERMLSIRSEGFWVLRKEAMRILRAASKHRG